MSNIIDIRTARSKREEEKLSGPVSGLEKKLKEFAKEVDARLRDLEDRQKRIDSILSRILKRLAQQDK